MIRKFLLAGLIVVGTHVQAVSQEISLDTTVAAQDMYCEIAQEVEKLKRAGMSDEQIVAALASSEKAQNWSYIYKKNKKTITVIGIAVCGVICLALVGGLYFLNKIHNCSGDEMNCNCFGCSRNRFLRAERLDTR